jgi:hypothetical protein
MASLCHRGLHDCDELSAPYKINRDGVIIASPPAAYPNRCTRQGPYRAGSGGIGSVCATAWRQWAGTSSAAWPGPCYGRWRGGDRWPLGSKTGSKRAAI